MEKKIEIAPNFFSNHKPIFVLKQTFSKKNVHANFNFLFA